MEMFQTPYGGLLGIIHLVIFIWALVQILTSSMPASYKLLWTIVVLALPVVGIILYLLFGRTA